jgi:hypothetical protein
MVHTLDEAVGALLDEVDRSGQADRTVIIFISDNGGNMYSLVDGTVPTDNAPLRGGKANIFEGGIRVPAVVVWPGVTEPGSRTDVIIQSTDLYPTILSMLGLAPPQDHPLDGEDFTPLLRGEDWQRARPIITYFPHNPPVHDWLPPSMAIHEGDWKLIRLFHQGQDGEHDYLLFNLREDMGETTNLANRYPERVRTMDRLMEDYIQEAGVVVPVRNPDFDPSQYRPELIGVQNIDGRPRPPVIPDSMLGPRLREYQGWIARNAEFEQTENGTWIHVLRGNALINKHGFLVNTPAALELHLEVAENILGRVQWRKTDERDFEEDAVVHFKVRPNEQRVTVPLPLAAGDTIQHLRVFLPVTQAPIKLHEIQFRGEDGTSLVDPF